jgi:hypothetical protein
MKTNTKAPKQRRVTHEGATAKRIGAASELRRTVMACLLWEDSFYESGVSVADRIAKLVPEVTGAEAMQIAIEAREQMKLRHVPLYIARVMARTPHQKEFVADTLYRIVQRPDEITEFMSLYQKK